MANWFLVYCKAKNEVRAKNNFANQKIEVFLPTIEVLKVVRGKRVTRVEPLFPCYIFICLELGAISYTTIESTRGVRRLVKFGGEVKQVPEAVIHQLKVDLGLREKSGKILDQLPKPGTKIDIIKGAFKGLEAVYHMSKGEERSLVLIEMLGNIQTMALKNKDLRF